MHRGQVGKPLPIRSSREVLSRIMTPNEFIDRLVTDALNFERRYSLPAAALIAQAALETGWGRRVNRDMETGRESYNLFNIKGKGPAGSVRIRTHEYVGGRRISVVDEFRAYHNFEQCFEDYCSLILKAPRYAKAREAARAGDPFRYAEELQAAGYATDPEYARKIAAIMRQRVIPKLARFAGQEARSTDTAAGFSQGGNET